MADKAGLVAEHISLCRSGAVDLLQRKNFGLVLTARTLDELEQVLRRETIFLVTVNIDLPGLFRSEGLKRIKLQWPSVRIVVLSEDFDRASILECLAAGVHGCISKMASSEEMDAAFDLILDGGVYLPPAISDLHAVAKSPTYAAEGHEDDALTVRQREVLALLAEGKSNKEIARILGISDGTVKVHINAAFRSLGVHNRVGAAAAFHDLVHVRKDASPGTERHSHAA